MESSASAQTFPWVASGDFRDAPRGVLYMNSAGKSPLPVAVEEAGKEAVAAQVT